MKIEIIAVESLGVRGLCCSVSTSNRKILIDPGIALGYMRNKLLPHPLQVAVDEIIQKRIIESWSKATDIIISHFHGDHIPLTDANPYQLSAEKLTGLNEEAKIWAKSTRLSKTEEHRAISLSFALNRSLTPSDGRSDGLLSFSYPVPHGDPDLNTDTVIMTRIQDDLTFVHASDIQLLNDSSVEQILSWKPDIVLASGPPIYLERLPGHQVEKAFRNALKLSEKVDKLVIDHHLMRSKSGAQWLDRLSKVTKNVIICGADFMNKPRMLLEARRKELYKRMPVPESWHDDYKDGRVNPRYYIELSKKHFGDQFKEKI